jgi:hypothetical protein
VITASALQVRVSDRKENTVIDKSMDGLVWLRKQLETDDNDLLREMVSSFAQEVHPPSRMTSRPFGHHRRRRPTRTRTSGTR